MDYQTSQKDITISNSGKEHLKEINYIHYANGKLYFFTFCLPHHYIWSFVGPVPLNGIIRSKICSVLFMYTKSGLSYHRLVNYSNSRWCSALVWMSNRSANGPLISLTLSLNNTMALPSFLQ
jgi:hypothetical protein